MGVVPPAGSIAWLNTVAGGTTNQIAEPMAVGGSGVRVDSLSIVEPSLPAGGYMGEGLLPIPDKLVKRILNLEFIELREMLPEAWLREEEEVVARNVLMLPKRKVSQIIDIGLWVQTFAGYISVLSTKYPLMVPEVLAYMAMMVKFSRNYEGAAWARYDMLYRKQMAKLRDLRWSRLNPTLFNLCFAGKAKQGTACRWCLSDNHPSAECEDNPANSGWSLPGVGDTGPALSKPGNAWKDKGKPNQGALKICYLYNRRHKNECTYDPCKYAHICMACKGNHPRSECTASRGGGYQGGTPGAKRPRMN